ncbi:MAG: type IV pilus twitching motility protein PilT [Spartobacteria bacterium]|nr:type IV pilus twitching motility protein PilT [Spartobacteria bacterium]
MAAIDRMLNHLVASGGSDLHLSTGYHPCMRIDGEILFMKEYPVLTNEAAKELLYEIMDQSIEDRFESTWDSDFAYALEGAGRFRVNVFNDHNGVGGVLRLIPSKIPSLEDLNMPDAIHRFCYLSKGLVIVTGPTGSGKSTTLAAMIDMINRTRREHIITIEDPIEFLHRSKGCLVNQREIFAHTLTFGNALRAALREDPDIVLVGEMRDLETIEIAIETAETGHLVFATLHTNTAATTVDRIIDKFPSERQNQIRTMLADTLVGIVAQTLCKKIGGGRIAATEILVVTPAVASNIREGKTHQIPSAMQTGKVYGMQMFGECLLDQVQQGIITPQEAYLKAIDKEFMIQKFKENGITVDLKVIDFHVPGDDAHDDQDQELQEIFGDLKNRLTGNPHDYEALRHMALIMSTHPNPKARNGREAVKIAEGLLSKEDHYDASDMVVLALAHAECGDFSLAIEASKRAIKMAKETRQRELIPEIESYMKLFKRSTPVRG